MFHKKKTGVQSNCWTIADTRDNVLENANTVCRASSQKDANVDFERHHCKNIYNGVTGTATNADWVTTVSFSSTEFS